MQNTGNMTMIPRFVIQDPTGVYRPDAAVRESFVSPLNGQILDDHGNVIDPDDLLQGILDGIGDYTDQVKEVWLQELFSIILTYYDKDSGLTVQSAPAVQSYQLAAPAEQADIPYPNAVVRYIAQDLRDVCQAFMKSACSYDKLFCTFAFYCKSDTLGFYFRNTTEFEKFKNWMNNELANIQLDQFAQGLFTQFNGLALDGLTESIRIRESDDDGAEPGCFARVLVYLLETYASQADEHQMGVFPFHLGEMFNPKTVVMINLDRHAQAGLSELSGEWNVIKKALKRPPCVMNKSEMQSLTALERDLEKCDRQAVARERGKDDSGKAMRAFSKTEITPVNIAKRLKHVMERLEQVAMSENSFKSEKKSYLKANRRHPDDMNLQGKLMHTEYYPDIHVYLDTSGSISEENYSDGVRALVKMAKKLNVNFYLNSFSHYLTPQYHIRVQGKSTASSMKAIRELDMAQGGTAYDNVWDYIQADKKRRRQLSVIITDFQYTPPSGFPDYPKQLYYMPISNTDWDYLVDNARDFAEGMKHIDPKIRDHMLL